MAKKGKALARKGRAIAVRAANSATRKIRSTAGRLTHPVLFLRVLIANLIAMLSKFVKDVASVTKILDKASKIVTAKGARTVTKVAGRVFKRRTFSTKLCKPPSLLPLVLLLTTQLVIASRVQILRPEATDGVPVTLDCPVIQPGHQPDIDLICITTESLVPERATVRIGSSTSNYDPYLPMPLMYHAATNYYEQTEETIGKIEKFIIHHWKEIIGFVIASALVDNSSTRLVLLLAVTSYMMSPVKANELQVEIRDILKGCCPNAATTTPWTTTSTQPLSSSTSQAVAADPAIFNVLNETYWFQRNVKAFDEPGFNTERGKTQYLTIFCSAYYCRRKENDRLEPPLDFAVYYQSNGALDTLTVFVDQYFSMGTQFCSTGVTRFKFVDFGNKPTLTVQIDTSGALGDQSQLTRTDIASYTAIGPHSITLIPRWTQPANWALTLAAWTECYDGMLTIVGKPRTVGCTGLLNDGLGTHDVALNLEDYGRYGRIYGTTKRGESIDLKYRCFPDECLMRGQSVKGALPEHSGEVEKLDTLFRIAASGTETYFLDVICAYEPYVFQEPRGMGSGCVSLSTHDILTTGTTSWTEFTVTHGQCVSIKATGKPAISFTYVGGDYTNALIPDRAFLLRTQVNAVEFHDRCPSAGTAVCPIDGSPNSVTTYTFNDRGWGNGCGLFAKGSICGTITLAPVLTNTLHVYDIDYDKVDHSLEVSIASGVDKSSVIVMPGIATSDQEVDFGVYGVAYIRCSPATTTKWASSKWTVFASDGGSGLSSEGWAIPRDAYRVLHLPWMSLTSNGTVEGNILEAEKMVKWGTPRANTIDYSLKEAGKGALITQFAKYPSYPLHGRGPLGVPDVLNCRAKTSDLKWFGTETAPCADYPTKILYEDHPQVDTNGLIHVSVEVSGLGDHTCRLTSKLTVFNEDRAPLAGLQMGTDPILDSTNSTGTLHYRVPSGPHYLWIGSGTTALKIAVDNKRSYATGVLTDVGSVWRNFISTSGVATPDDVAGGPFAKGAKIFGNFFRGFSHNIFGASGVLWDYALAAVIIYISANFLSGPTKMVTFGIGVLIIFATYVSGAEAGFVDKLGTKTASVVGGFTQTFSAAYHAEMNRRSDRYDPPGWFSNTCRHQLAVASGFIKESWHYYLGLAYIIAACYWIKTKGLPNGIQFTLAIAVAVGIMTTQGMANTSVGTYSSRCYEILNTLGYSWDVTKERQYTIFTSFVQTPWAQRGAWNLGVTNNGYFDVFILPLLYVTAAVFVIGTCYTAAKRPLDGQGRNHKAVLAALLIGSLFVNTTLATPTEVEPQQGVYWDHQTISGCVNWAIATAIGGIVSVLTFFLFTPAGLLSLISFSVAILYLQFGEWAPRKKKRLSMCLAILLFVSVANANVDDSAPRLIRQLNDYVLDGLNRPIPVAILVSPLLVARVTDAWYYYAAVACALLPMSPTSVVAALLTGSHVWSEILVAYALKEPMAPMFLRLGGLVGTLSLLVYYVCLPPGLRAGIAIFHHLAKGTITATTCLAIAVGAFCHYAIVETLTLFGFLYILYLAYLQIKQRQFSWKASTVTISAIIMFAILAPFVPDNMREHMVVPCGAIILFGALGEKLRVVATGATRTVKVTSAYTKEFPSNKIMLDDNGDFVPETRYPYGIVIMTFTILTSFYVGPAAFVIGVAVLAGVAMKYSGDDYLTPSPEQLRQDGPVYIVKDYYGLFSRKVGCGYVYKGVLHTSEHVTNMDDIEWVGKKWSPVMINRYHDVVTYGGDYCFPEPDEGDATLVVVRNGVRYEEKICFKQMEQNSILTAATDVMKQGDSGSAVLQDGAPVAVAGNMATAAGQHFMIAGRVPTTLKPTSDMYEACEKHGLNVEGIHYPGAGKTRSVIMALVRRCKELNRPVWLCVPTRVVATELRDAISGSSYVSHTRAFRSTSTGSKTHIICHATLLQVLATESPTITGLLIMDESHFADDRSQALKYWARNQADIGAISFIELTATGDTVCDNNSRFDITDKKIRTSDVAETIRREINEENAKIIIFVPSADYHPAKKAIESSGVKTEVINLNRSTFAENNQKARDMTNGIIVATNIAEVGGNYQVDVVIDYSMTLFPVIDQENGVFLTPREESKSSAIQRRGRVGRSKVGRYYYTDEPGDYHIWPVDAVQHFELGLWLSLFGLPPLPSTPDGANFDGTTQVQRSTFLKNVEGGMSTYFSYQLAVRNATTTADIIGQGVAAEDGEYTTYDSRHKDAIRESARTKRPIVEYTLSKFSITVLDSILSATHALVGDGNALMALGVGVIVGLIFLIATASVTRVLLTEFFSTIRTLAEAVIRTDVGTVILPAAYMFIGADLTLDIGGPTFFPKEAIGLAAGFLFLSVAKASDKSYTGMIVTVMLCLPKMMNLIPTPGVLTASVPTVGFFGLSPYITSTTAITGLFMYQALAETAYASSCVNQLVRMFEDVKMRHAVQPVTTYRSVDWASALGFSYLVATKTFLSLVPGIGFGLVLLSVAGLEGRTKALLAYLTGKEELDAADVPDPTNSEERKTNVKVVIALLGVLGCVITASPHGLVCVYPILMHFLYKSGKVKERLLADYPASIVVISMGTGDIYLTTIAGAYLYLRKTFKFGKTLTATTISNKFNEWKNKLGKLDSYSYAKYKDAHVYQRPSDENICSRGTYKMQDFIDRRFHTPRGIVLDLGCGAGGFSQAALATRNVRKVTGYTLSIKGHHVPKLDRFRTLGYNLFSCVQADIYKTSFSKADTLYCDIGESHKSIEVERERTGFHLDQIARIFEEVRPSAWCIKIHAAHSEENMLKCRILQTKYGGGFVRSVYSRNANAEIYYCEGSVTTVETTMMNLVTCLLSRFVCQPPINRPAINYPLGAINLIAPELKLERPKLRFEACRARATEDQPYSSWYKWGEVRSEKDKVNSENRNPIIEGLTRGLRRLVHGSNEWGVTETSAAGVQEVFLKKVDKAPNNSWTADTVRNYRDMALWLEKTKPPPRVLTDDEVVDIFRNDAAIGALPLDENYENTSQAFKDPKFWEAVREEEKLHACHQCSRGIFNTMAKNEKKRKKGAYGSRPASRIIAYLPLVERFLEQKYLGWLNQDHWCARERLPSGIGGMPIHYLGGLLAAITEPDCDGTLRKPAIQTDIAGWDTRLGLPFLEQEVAMIMLRAKSTHVFQMATIYSNYKRPLILVKRPDPKAPGYAVTELIQTVGQRMSGTVVTYTMNTITNTLVNLYRMWESFGMPPLAQFLEEKGMDCLSRMVISGDDCVIVPERPEAFAKSLAFMNETGLIRKDIGAYEPDRVITHYHDLDMCSHKFRWVLFPEGRRLYVTVKPEEEILGKGMYTIGAMSTAAIPGMAKAMANYWMMIFPFQRDIRLAARAIRSCVDQHSIPMGKIKDPYISDQPWMTTEDTFEVWHRIWLTENPFVTNWPIIRGWDEVPYLSQVEDRDLGSAIHDTERAAWKGNLASHVKSIRRIWDQSEAPDEIPMARSASSWL